MGPSRITEKYRYTRFRVAYLICGVGKASFSVADPGFLSRNLLFSIPDPRSRIRIKEFRYLKLNPKKWFLSSRKYDPGCSSRIRIITFYPSRIPDPGVKKAPDPGSGSATQVVPVLLPIHSLWSFSVFAFFLFRRRFWHRSFLYKGTVPTRRYGIVYWHLPICIVGISAAVSASHILPKFFTFSPGFSTIYFNLKIPSSTNYFLYC